MKIAGIIAEYDPFHNGHAYHIDHTRAEKEGNATHVVAVMSGHFTQRGAPAVVDPHIRAEAALKCGVDLVISLPVPWALSSAQGFARGGVYLLEALGCVDMISFGSECGNIDTLKTVRRLLDDPRVTQRFQGLMSTGLSYADARRKAVGEIGGENRAKILDSPNNTLALEYLGALREFDSPIEPFTVARMGAEHESMETVGDMASASYIRTILRTNRVKNLASFVPREVCDILFKAIEDGACPSREALAERAVLAVLRMRTKEQFASLPAVSEGIENRLYDAVRTANSLEDLLETAKTRRYPRTRLQRLVYAAFLGITADVQNGLPPYIRVLGANDKGLEILQKAKANSTALPIVSRASQIDKLDDRARHVFKLENRAADLHALFLPTPPPCGSEMTTGMIRI